MNDEPRFLTIVEILRIHQDMVVHYGGTLRIHDQKMLKSAVLMPAQSFGNQFAHAGLFEMAAAYLFHIVQNHPFVDGNQATGLACALVFLEINGHPIEPKSEELEALVWDTAQGKADKARIAEFFRAAA